MVPTSRVRRKILRDGGQAFEELLVQMEHAAGQLDAAAPLRAPLLAECAALRPFVQQLLGAGASQTERVGSIAYPFLQWLGVVAGGWQWAVAAHAATRRARDSTATRSTLDHAEFYAAHILPRARSFAAIAAGGSDIINRARL